jgi:thiamine-monophosphate kinase
MPPPRPRPTEDELIARYFAPLAGEGGLALKDDAALLKPLAGHELVLTVDALVAGVHFFPDDPPEAIAVKALGVNVSDLAAKGASPAGYLLALALPDDWSEAWLAAFTAGLGKAAQAFACPLLGGDTVRAGGALSLSITAVGQVPAGRMVRRTTAQAGDRICVTGTIGDATLGLALRQSTDAPPWASSLTGEEQNDLLDRYLRPRPRLALAPVLREYAHAAMDVSDGLAGDLAKMMRASGASAVVDMQRVPLSPAARAALAGDSRLMDRLVTGGDDYEILCTLPETRITAFLRTSAAAGVPATVIGTVVEGGGLPVFRSEGRERRFESGSFSHF